MKGFIKIVLTVVFLVSATIYLYLLYYSPNFPAQKIIENDAMVYLIEQGFEIERTEYLGYLSVLSDISGDNNAAFAVRVFTNDKDSTDLKLIYSRNEEKGWDLIKIE